MYKIFKEDFTIYVLKVDNNFQIVVSRGNETLHYCCVSGNVFIFSGGKWVLLNTNRLVHKQKYTNYPLGESRKKYMVEKSIFDVFKVILLYPVNGKYLKLNYDERMLLEQITYSLYLKEDRKNILPVEEYTLKENKLFYESGGYEYYHLMPSSENMSEEEFIEIY